MSAAELDAFLGAQRTCRVGTVGQGGRPHVSPLWFVWDGRRLWLYSIIRSQRWVDIERNPLVSVVVDAGEEYSELRGVEVLGAVEPVGELPRSGTANPELEEPERLFTAKYTRGTMAHDGRHGWLRVTPTKLVSWDFRKTSDA